MTHSTGTSHLLKWRRLAAAMPVAITVAMLGSATPPAHAETPDISTNAPANAAASTQVNKDWQACRNAAHHVERATDIPNALLQAMSLVETGRRGPDGKHTAWPWTINSNGKGYRFATKEEAVWAVRRLRADGVRSIDVGCMQVNLRYHPRAFTSLEEAFDPAANMAYAASFLTRLNERHGNWRAASARYHSYNPKLREKYAKRVDTTLARERRALASAAPVPSGPESQQPFTTDLATETSPITTASVSAAPNISDLGLRPTLIPGLRRGLDVVEPDQNQRKADAGSSPAAPHLTALNRVASR